MTSIDTATDKRKTPWFPIDNIIIDEFNLTPQEGWLYIVIVKFANRKTGEAFPSHATLAKTANMSKSSVIRCITSLEEKKLIEVERTTKPGKKQRAVNHYTVLDPHAPPGGSVTEIPPSVRETPGVVSESNMIKNQLNKTKEQEREGGLAAEGKQEQPADPPSPSSESHDATVDLDLIGAWRKALPNPPVLVTYSPLMLGLQDDLIDANVTAQDVRDFVTEKHDPERSDDYWLDKVMSFKHVANNIMAWKNGKAAKAAANPPPRPAVHFPKPRRDCDTCGGTGMQLGPKNESLPCPACLEAERNAKEVTHEQG